MRTTLTSLGLFLCAAPAWALEPGQPQRVNSAGGEIRMGLLTGDPAELHPDAGFGIGLDAQWYYRPGLGLLIDGDYDRFGDPSDKSRQLALYSFAVQQVFAIEVARRWLPWAGIGGAIVVGLFRDDDRLKSTAEPDPDGPAPFSRTPPERSELMPALRATVGCGWEMAPRSVLGLRVEYNRVFTKGTVTDGNVTPPRELRTFDDTIHLALAAEYYF